VSHVREQIVGALDLIVHMSRTSEGSRVVARISAVEGLRSDSVVLEDIFSWRRGPGPAFEATGRMPSVMKLLEERDERVDPRVFTNRVNSGPDEGHSGWQGSIRQLGALVE
jgi:pilus assembly protein CpaF